MRPPLNPLLGQLTAYMQEALNRVRASAVARGGPVYDFGIGDPREPTPAFIRDALKDAVPEVSQYPSVAGAPELRKAGAAYLKRRFAIDVDPDRELLPCGGAKEALFHLPLIAVSRERPICFYPDPAYPVYERAILFAQGEPRTLPLLAERDFLPDLDAIDADTWRRTAIVFDNYPHNPTGAMAPRAHHEKLFALAREHGFLVVCDEPYTDLYTGAPPHSGLQIGRENVVGILSLSKRSGMTGYRSGLIVAEPWLTSTLREARANFGVAPSSFVQAAAAKAWSDDAHVEERRAIFARKRSLLLAHLNALGLRVGGTSESAFYLWVHVPEGHTSETYAEHLAKSGILVAPGTFFGASGNGFVRLAMVPTVEDCDRAIAAWPR